MKAGFNGSPPGALHWSAAIRLVGVACVAFGLLGLALVGLTVAGALGVTGPGTWRDPARMVAVAAGCLCAASGHLLLLATGVQLARLDLSWSWVLVRIWFVEAGLASVGSVGFAGLALSGGMRGAGAQVFVGLAAGGATLLYPWLVGLPIWGTLLVCAAATRPGGATGSVARLQSRAAAQ